MFGNSKSASLLFSVPSMRLAYKDLEQHRKIEEQKLKGMDGKKKEQAERLGMGLGIRRYVDDDDDEETSHPVIGVRFHTFVFAVFAAECLTLSHQTCTSSSRRIHGKPRTPEDAGLLRKRMMKVASALGQEVFSLL